MSYEGMSANELGKVAYRRGLPIDSNPFRDNTEEAKDFNAGWKFEHKITKRDANEAYRSAKRTWRNEHNS